MNEEASDNNTAPTYKRKNSPPPLDYVDELNGSNRKEEDSVLSCLEKSIHQMSLSSASEIIDEEECQSPDFDVAADTEQKGRKKGIIRKRSSKKRKSVHFADTSGRMLETIFKAETEEEINSDSENSLYVNHLSKNDLLLRFQDDTSAVNDTSSATAASNQLVTKLQILFEQPAARHDFHIVLRQNKVKLENMVINKRMCLGMIKVRNIAFEKQVFVRYTFDDWKTSGDLPAEYYHNSSSSYSDTFTFRLFIPEEGVRQAEFAVCFQCQGIKYWDNNCDKNYCIKCYAV